MGKDLPYYMLDCRAPEAMRLESLPRIGKQTWYSGRRFTEPVPIPLVVDIREGYEDSQLLEFFRNPMLMRQDLVECLRNAGVDNLDAYDAIIQDTENDLQYDNYKAVNIIGVISAADPDGTIFRDDNPSRIVDADIDSLKIDEKKTGGALLFRLAEAVTGIVVHRRVKQAIEAAGFKQMVFIDPAEWAG
jgi:hypothetical protein